jgi:hypothetical protein
MNITVSYAGQDGTARPFLMIINWLRVGKDWKVASEIILPVTRREGLGAESLNSCTALSASHSSAPNETRPGPS